MAIHYHNKAKVQPHQQFTNPPLGPIKEIGVQPQLTKTPGSIRAAAPELGQHTEEILIDTLQYTWDEVTKLKEQGVI